MSEQQIQQKFQEQMSAIARAIQEIFNGPVPVEKSKVGFALLVFDMEVKPENRTNYMSNVNRKDMLNAMKEFIARAEGHIKDEESLQ